MEYFQSLSAYLWMDKTNISHDTVVNRIKEGTLVLGLCKSDILPVLYEMRDEKKDADTSGEEDNTDSSLADAESEGENDNTDNSEDGSTDNKDETNYQVAYVPSLTSELSSTCYSTT